ncbi:MAG: 23S rRNA (adenine(2503)-C(2))-methyltransferase RlmN [Rikenellaceae bacterium]
MTQNKEPLYGKTLVELEVVCAELSLPKFAAKQIANWLYDKSVSSIEQMTNLSQSARAALSEKYCVGLVSPIKVSEAKDGTKKYLFQTSQGHLIEAAYIPSADRATLCVSSQAGCRMGCTFCATGRQGLQHSLSVCEILNQIASIEESKKLTNIVYMGMGEPLDNTENVIKSLEVLTSTWGYGWSPSRITVSTAGVGKNLRKLLDSTQVHLAVSLHNPYSDERSEIMPIERAYPIAEIMEILRQYDFSRQRRLSFEYIVMSGKNNHPHHIKELCKLLNGVKCRINLIKFHKIPDSPYYSPDDEKMIRFRDTLTQKGIHTTIRVSRGEEIQAACGLLSTKVGGAEKN